MAACGEFGDFPLQIHYFGDVRATFEVFFPGPRGGVFFFLNLLVPIAIDRFEHCNFTSSEVLATFAIMLLYDGAIADVSGISTAASHQQIAAALASKLKK